MATQEVFIHLKYEDNWTVEYKVKDKANVIVVVLKKPVKVMTTDTTPVLKTVTIDVEGKSVEIAAADFVSDKKGEYIPKPAAAAGAGDGDAGKSSPLPWIIGGVVVVLVGVGAFCFWKRK